ncbi:MAG: hypothetical protein V3V02_08000 [Rhizobiaceae bacterium]
MRVAPLAKIAALALIASLAACTKSKPPSTPPVASKTSQERPQTLMARVARQAQTCWFKKKDPAFRKYKMATELDSYSGKPRILIVPRNNPAGLPKLVAQAERRGGRNQFTTFGPLLNSKHGPRLAASLNAWARGSKSC